MRKRGLHDLKHSSIDIGKSSCYFSVLKKKNPVLFRFVTFHGGRSLVFGYEVLRQYILRLKEKVQRIYFSYKQPFTFAKELHQKGLYKSSLSAMNGVQFIFGNNDLVPLETVYKMKKIIKEFRR